MRNPTRPVRHAVTALLLALLVAACGGPAPQTQGGPALWRVTDADSTIYLFGTVHALPADTDWRSPRIDAAFAQAERVYLEAAATEPLAPETLAALGQEPPERRLAAILTPAERAMVEADARALGQEPAELLALRPWLAAVRLSVVEAMRQGQDPAHGVDPILDADARAAGKEVRYFETVEQQLGFLAGLSPMAERQFFMATLRQLRADDGTLGRMDDFWLTGDTKALEAELMAQFADAGPEVIEAVLTRRNARWADAIEQELAGEGVVFVGVGAAHLLGEDSLVAILRDRGHKIDGP